MRKYAEIVYRVPSLRPHANEMAMNLLKYARRHGLEFALVTKKF
jgi:hypothetical protein